MSDENNSRCVTVSTNEKRKALQISNQKTNRLSRRLDL
jgi:hypothetical protein